MAATVLWVPDRGRLLAKVTPALPRRVRVERGIYRNPSTGRLEIQYTDENGRVRWKTLGGTLAQARLARVEAQRSRRLFADVAEEWFAGQTRLRRRTFGKAGAEEDAFYRP